jgi:hypothetical protein
VEQAAYPLNCGDALDAYGSWPVPAAIISDGAYGVCGFHGDTTGVTGLGEWYLPHVQAWSGLAAPATTLWFWNTEVGWASVHPLLAAHGWEYVQAITWDKGTGHIADNVNGQVVTEICFFYRCRIEMAAADLLRRRVRRAQLGEFFLDLGERADVPVVLGVRNRWRVQHVVAVLRLGQLLAHARRARCRASARRKRARFSERDCSIVAASVHGPASCTLSGPL